jgi:hypothetical protein
MGRGGNEKGSKDFFEQMVIAQFEVAMWRRPSTMPSAQGDVQTRKRAVEAALLQSPRQATFSR